ncbi:hypothetical protein SAMN04488542_11624 [Fontibacillus panacisegetis]|uniref:Uncharacterized protein n=1 Tax=Fontibacillus panacisegetis TaxID=670482 RepID=A0A1G7NJU9_9BACL|nr:hypothetical protein SAMN04488542_11624 [Fontibacillus panacisegetis]
MHYDLKEKRGIGIKLYEKIYPHIAKDLRKFLSENNISTKKLVIDLEAETIEDFNDYINRPHSRVSGGLGKVTRSHSGYLFDSNKGYK